MKSNRSVQRKTFVALALLLGLAWTALAVSTTLQDPKTLLFQDAQEAGQKAKAAEAHIFSPDQFSEGVKYYQEADDDYKKGRNLEDIRKKLKMATVYFLKSVETTKLFKTNLADCVAARNDALAAEAPQYRKEDWEEAEEALEQAAKTLEDGNLNGAQSKARKAERLYRQVELESIKANYLDETKTLLEEARKKDVRKYAPLTLAKAQELVERAEKFLVENRYDTDEPRQIAQEAKYEAKHALYLAQLIETLDKEKKTVEAILLDSETPIRKIADEFNLNARFAQGFDEPTAAIVQKIQDLQKQNASLEQDLSDKRVQLTTLQDQVTRMESQLGDLKTKEATLTQIMEQQQILREKFARVENAFTPEEAKIVREGETVIIRLYGLTFPVGKSTIETQYFGLLSKVIKAIDEYPESGVTVEGHTDSWGSDATNQKLSTERAEAVQEYLLASSGIDAARIIAVGYGETKPIAPNETTEGRRKNRRIDIVIHPKK